MDEKGLKERIVKTLNREFGDDYANGSYHEGVANRVVDIVAKSHKISTTFYVASFVEYSYKDAVLGRRIADITRSFLLS